jgi:C4-dicarboxylate-specific signal transduction histidine kinase
MTAGATHEFLNVLAIISEASGLLQDILSLNRGEPSSWDEKAKASLARIRRQIDRGTDLSECLNKFAHSLDESGVRVDMNDTLDRVAVLMRHAARLEKVVLQTQRGEPSPVIVTNPLHLQIVLATFIEWCLDLASPGGTITLHALDLDEDVAIRCETAPRRVDVQGDTSAGQRLAALEDLVCELGMRIVHEGPHPFEAVELRIPRR